MSQLYLQMSVKSSVPPVRVQRVATKASEVQKYLMTSSRYTCTNSLYKLAVPVHLYNFLLGRAGEVLPALTVCDRTSAGPTNLMQLVGNCCR